MTDPDVRISTTLDEMRRSFDAGFSAPLSPQSTEFAEYLAVRIGEDPFAIDTRSITGIEARLGIVALPAEAPELLGVAGIRGRLIPIYSLALLLGYAKTGAEGRWVVLAASDPPVGFAFAEFEGILRLSRETGCVIREEQGRPHAGEALQVGGVIRHVLHLPSLIAATRRGTGASAIQGGNGE